MGLDTSLFIVLKEMSQDLRWTLEYCFEKCLWDRQICFSCWIDWRKANKGVLIYIMVQAARQARLSLHHGWVTPFFPIPPPRFLSMQAGIICGKATKHDLALPRRLIILLQVCCCVQRHIKNPEPEVGVRTEHAGKKTTKTSACTQNQSR